MAQPNPIRILSVEDHPVFREGLTRIRGSQADMLVGAQVDNAEAALAEFRRHRLDITLMDLGHRVPMAQTRSSPRLCGATSPFTVR